MVRDSMALEFERTSADQSEGAVAQVPTHFYRAQSHTESGSSNLGDIQCTEDRSTLIGRRHRCNLPADMGIGLNRSATQLLLDRVTSGSS